jgi:GNAT superfamily N-acetyltransferase
MYDPYILSLLAKERQATMLADAERARRAMQARRDRRAQLRQADPGGRTTERRRWWTVRRPVPTTGAPAGQPLAGGQPVMLRDGSRVLIRPVQRGDGPLLAEGFGRLSAESRWMRFMMAKKVLTPAELRYLTDVDHHDHEALGALARKDGPGVGIARYVRDTTDPRTAEVAITVIDDWQHRGLGRELLDQLSSRACQEGISQFTALVSADNKAMTGLLDSMCADLVHRDPDTLTYQLALGCDPCGSTTGACRS